MGGAPPGTQKQLASANRTACSAACVQVLRRIVAGEEVRGAHQVLASRRLKDAGLDTLDIVARVEQQQAEEQRRRQQQMAAA